METQPTYDDPVFRVKQLEEERRHDRCDDNEASSFSHRYCGQGAETPECLQREVERCRKMEKALRESEERYRAVVEDQGELICRVRPDFTMTFVNGALCRYFSATPEDLIGKSFLPLLYEEVQPNVVAFYSSLTPEHPFGTSEQQVRLPNEEIRWQQWSVRALYNESGELSGYQSVGRDITDRLKIEEALRESEERYRIVAKHSADGIVVMKKGRLLYVNDAFAFMCGHNDPGQLIGKDFSNYIDVAQRENFTRYMDSIEARHGKDSLFQAKIIRPDGRELWGEGLQTVIQWSGRPAVLSTVRNITRAKQREMATRREANALRRQNRKLVATIRDRFRLGDIVGKSHAMQEVYEQILAASASDTNVVVYGESGTGKELVANAIHNLSDRSGGALVPVNCNAIPEHLMESEFFGHSKGAFTGANSPQMGLLDVADGGTLFLDEVGDISLNMQVKLLRAIEGGGHIPLGSSQVRTADFRIVSATNRQLSELVEEGRIREDFFYRIHIVPIYLPPLRKRKEDILLLIDHFMRAFYHDKNNRPLPGKILDAFVDYDWPGNVRELQNVLHRYITMGHLEFSVTPRAETVTPIPNENPAKNTAKNTSKNPAKNTGENPAPPSGDAEVDDLRVRVNTYEKQIIFQALERCRWNRTRASAALGIPRRTLYDKMMKHGIALPDMRDLRPTTHSTV